MEAVMARPRIFVSSTFYDLKQVRADLELFIKELGYESMLNERGQIPYGNSESLESYCYDEISNCDIVVSIVGGRYGAQSAVDDYSISQMELKTAAKLNKQIFVFVENSVHSEYRTYLRNKGKDIEFASVDNPKIYAFVEEVYGLPRNNPIASFESSQEIVSYLKEQWAGLFQRYLRDQTQLNQVEMIQNMKDSVDSLTKLVNFLVTERKNGELAIRTVMLMNHPLFSALKRKLEIPYRVFFQDLAELNSWLPVRGYRKSKESTDKAFLEWTNKEKGKTTRLSIVADLFDDNGNLKSISADEWDDDWIILEVVKEKDLDDDIPF
jgi:hypothetical protein